MNRSIFRKGIERYEICTGGGRMYRDADIEARLDLSCYKGEDLYADGDIEDRLLELVKTYPGTAYNQLLRSENSWPILYHLFNLRENVLNW